jgi:hypothetical protein
VVYTDVELKELLPCRRLDTGFGRRVLVGEGRYSLLALGRLEDTIYDLRSESFGS